VYTHMLMQSPLCIVSKKLKRGMELKEIFLQERVYLPSRSLESRADFDHWVESNGLSFQVAGQIEDVALLRLIALSGKGIVVIPRMGVLKDLESRTLSVLHEFKGIKQKYYAITRQKKVPNTFISELIKNLKNLG
jgi:LysR family transcriptional regulator, transcriptional activator of nhaA